MNRYTNVEVDNLDKFTGIQVEVDEEYIVVRLNNYLEMNFLLRLVSKERTTSTELLTCIYVEKITKPIGYMEFTYKNITEILDYNPDLKIGIKFPDKEKILPLNIYEMTLLQ